MSLKHSLIDDVFKDPTAIYDPLAADHRSFTALLSLRPIIQGFLNVKLLETPNKLVLAIES